MMPGRMVFLRCNEDHHGLALVGGAGGPASGSELHHVAFEVGSLDELFRAREHLKRHGVGIAFEGRRRAGQQIALEFADPDNHQLEICWGIDRIADGAAARPPEEWRTASTLEQAVGDPPPGQAPRLADPSPMRK
jgi:catechol 2,3-dioxygenase